MKANNQRPAQNSQLSGNERIVKNNKAKKKSKKYKRLFFYWVLGIAVFVIGIIVAITVFFNIGEIKVTGDAVYSSDIVVNASEIEIGDNLIFISKSKINDVITEKLPYVGSVTVKRKLPSELEIKIQKTEAVYAVVSDGYYILLDKNAKVLEKDLEYIGDNIVLLNLGVITSSETGHIISLENDQTLLKLASVNNAFEEIGIADITSIDLSDLYNIKAVYQGRITLELGTTDKKSLSKKLALGKSAIETQDEENPAYRGTINLTVSGKGYWSEENPEVPASQAPVTEEPVTEIPPSETVPASQP